MKMTVEEMKVQIRKNYEEMYKLYYGSDDYVPLLTENYTKNIPQQVYDEFTQELLPFLYELLDEEVVEVGEAV